ncbi:hypothetical protein MT418_005155 [Batrachochytrium dendrobatidis]
MVSLERTTSGSTLPILPSPYDLANLYNPQHLELRQVKPVAVYNTTLKRSKTFPPLVRSSVTQKHKWTHVKSGPCSQHLSGSIQQSDQESDGRSQCAFKTHQLQIWQNRVQDPNEHRDIEHFEEYDNHMDTDESQHNIIQDSFLDELTAANRHTDDPQSVVLSAQSLATQVFAHDFASSIGRSLSTPPQLYSPPSSPPRESYFATVRETTTSSSSLSRFPIVHILPCASTSSALSSSPVAVTGNCFSEPAFTKTILHPVSNLLDSVPSGLRPSLVHVDSFDEENEMDASALFPEQDPSQPVPFLQHEPEQLPCVDSEHHEAISPHHLRLPGCRKSIKFAENIEHICHFTKTDSPCIVSDTETLDIKDNGDLDLGSVSLAFALSDKWRIASKNLPTHSYFGTHSVVLDQIEIDAKNQLCISILTRNIAYEKHVSVRFTINNWATFRDINATFQTTVTPNMGDYKGVDRFLVTVDLDSEFGPGVTTGFVEFAIRLCATEKVFWDNNGTCNYKLKLVLPLLLDTIYKSNLYEPIKSGFEWPDSFGRVANCRRHSFDLNTSSSAQAARQTVSNLLASKKHSASADHIASMSATSGLSSLYNSTTSVLQGTDRLPSTTSLHNTARPSASRNFSSSVAPLSPPSAAPVPLPTNARLTKLSRPLTPLFLPTSASRVSPFIQSTSQLRGIESQSISPIPSRLSPPQYHQSQTYSMTTSNAEIPFSNRLHSYSFSAQTSSYPYSISPPLGLPSTLEANAGSSGDPSMGSAFSTTLPIPIILPARGQRDSTPLFTIGGGFQTSMNDLSSMASKMSCSPPCRV